MCVHSEIDVYAYLTYASTEHQANLEKITVDKSNIPTEIELVRKAADLYQFTGKSAKLKSSHRYAHTSETI